ncbi:MAG TPA: hypothetical protein IAB56_04910 [Candidatus Scybalousia intestinigallinarum]|nr:hypothetical protein [Candidatus Scybalousia intestinigallinarum]
MDKAKSDKITLRKEEIAKQLQDLTDIQKKYYVYEKISELGLNANYNQLQESIGNNWTRADETLALISTLSDLESKEKVNLLQGGTLLAIKEEQVKKQTLYQEEIALFQNVLENYKKLAEELHLESTLEKCNLFSYLLWNGYFSYNKEHFYDLNDRHPIIGMYFLDIIFGRGVCLNYADALNRYLQVCGIESDPLICKVNSFKRQDLEYSPTITRNSKKAKISFSNTILSRLTFLVEKFGNHAITLVKDHDHYFAYDPTNLIVLNIDDDKTSSLVTGPFQFDLKFFTSFLITNDSGQLYNEMLSHPVIQGVSKDIVISSFENTLSIVSENRQLLDSAYDNIQPTLEKITQTCIEKKKRKKLW